MDVIYIPNLLGALVCLFIVRIFIVYLRIHKKKKNFKRFRLSAKLMIVLGSGGHTHEMLHLIRNVNDKISPRIYVLADTDILSEPKANKFEELLMAKSPLRKEYEPSEMFTIEKIPRSREVGQSWITTVFTTLKSCIYAFRLVFRHKPDAILYNGPGTCVPICLSAVLMHVLGLKHIINIYVESICRVKTLSLTGRILYYFADFFFVNWPQLKTMYPRSEYIGRLL